MTGWREDDMEKLSVCPCPRCGSCRETKFVSNNAVVCAACGYLKKPPRQTMKQGEGKILLEGR
jgi:hypothetical protein